MRAARPIATPARDGATSSPRRAGSRVRPQPPCSLGIATARQGARSVGFVTVVAVVAAPLVFRRWTRKTRMVRGDWNIPVPPPEVEAVTPEIALAPVVGWTAEGFRLGYGGGYFDRTLAALLPRPFTIGIGFQSARLATIYPQPHDIALDAVVTEAGIAVPPYGT